MIIQLLLVGTWVYYNALDAEVHGLPVNLSSTSVPLPGPVAAAVSYLPSAERFSVVREATADQYASFELRWLFIVVGSIFTTGSNTVSMLGRIISHYYRSSDSGAGRPERAHERELVVDAKLLGRQVAAIFVWCGLVCASWVVVHDDDFDTGVWPLWMALVAFGFGSFALENLVIRVTKRELPAMLRLPAFAIVAAWCVVGYAVPLEYGLARWLGLAAVAALAVLQHVDLAMGIAGDITTALEIPFWTVPKAKAAKE